MIQRFKPLQLQHKAPSLLSKLIAVKQPQKMAKVNAPITKKLTNSSVRITKKKRRKPKEGEMEETGNRTNRMPISKILRRRPKMPDRAEITDSLWDREEINSSKRETEIELTIISNQMDLFMMPVGRLL